jgi:hypothetical protein
MESDFLEEVDSLEEKLEILNNEIDSENINEKFYQENGSQNDLLLLVVRCVGLGVSWSKSAMKSLSKTQSMLTQAKGIFSSMNSKPKNEKRLIRISQSESFKPSGRPPKYDLHSFVYYFIYAYFDYF